MKRVRALSLSRQATPRQVVNCWLMRRRHFHKRQRNRCRSDTCLAAPQDTDSDVSGNGGTGSTAQWNGMLPSSAGGPKDSRSWGQPGEQLESEMKTGSQVSQDSEYQSRIQSYFREVARATGDTAAEPSQ